MPSDSAVVLAALADGDSMDSRDVYPCLERLRLHREGETVPGYPTREDDGKVREAGFAVLAVLAGLVVLGLGLLASAPATIAALLLAASGWAFPWPSSERGAIRILEQTEVTPRHASGAGFVSRIPVPAGLIRGMSFDLSGTTVTNSALNDDAPWTLVSVLRIVLPLKRGDVVLQSTGRDLFLLARYLNGNLRENQTSATAGVTFSSFFLPFGPRGWGIHSDALRPGAEIIVSGTWGPPSEYGAATTAITNGILRPSIYVEAGAPAVEGRRALIPVTTRLALESESRIPRIRINKPELAEGLFAILFRAEDSSVVGDREDGLVTRLQVNHPGLGTIVDSFFRSLRGAGLEWAGISPAEVTAALPLGLDGTALFVAAPTFDAFPDLMRSDIDVTYDAFETVQDGVTNVAPAAGDALHATVVATIVPGA
jgi:hypothetical protein